MSSTHIHCLSVTNSHQLSATHEHCPPLENITSCAVLRPPAPSERLRQPSSSGAQKAKYSTADNTLELFSFKNSLFTLKNGKIKTEQSVRFSSAPFFSLCRMFLHLRQKVACRGAESLTGAYLLIIRKYQSPNGYILLLSVIVCYCLRLSVNSNILLLSVCLSVCLSL